MPKTKKKYNGNMTDNKSFNQRVYDIIRRIPKGRVMSYGQIAALAGNSCASRAVGYAAASPYAPKLPFHRVVYKDGSCSPAFAAQRHLLRAEGVQFTKDGRVIMRRFAWHHEILEKEAFLKYG